MEFSRREFWSGVPFSTPGGLPNSGIKFTSLVTPALAGGFFTTNDTKDELNYIRSSSFPWLHPDKVDGIPVLQGC